MNNLLERAADVDGIPVVWIQPGNQDGDARIVLWLPWLTGMKEDAIPFLAELAGRGFTAVSFDLWQHGERGTETGEQIAARVFGGFRRHMWPILGQTTLDALRVADWAAAELGARDVAAGGVSAGGDIAVALAGIDQRISRVAAIAATPDWTRPGMRDIGDPSRVLPQGEPDAYAQWFYDHLDPLSHLGHYARAPATECGEQRGRVVGLFLRPCRCPPGRAGTSAVPPPVIADDRELAGERAGKCLEVPGVAGEAHDEQHRRPAAAHLVVELGAVDLELRHHTLHPGCHPAGAQEVPRPHPRELPPNSADDCLRALAPKQASR